MTRGKATEALINSARNYPDLLPEIPKYYCLVEVLYFFNFYKDMAEI